MRRFLFFAAACLALAGPLGAQSPPSAGSRPESENTFLEFGKPIEREMRGGEKHSYKVHAEAGQFVHVVVEQKGVNASVALYDSIGKLIVMADSLNGSYGPESVSTITQDLGDLHVEVSTSSPHSPAGPYEIQLKDLRAPTEADLTRIKAELTYAEGYVLYSRQDSVSARAAAAKWKESFALWQSLDDKYGQALSLYSAGVASYFSHDAQQAEKQTALDCYNQALPLERAVGDRAGEAMTLINIGSILDTRWDLEKALVSYNQALPLMRAVGNHPGEAETLDKIATVYARLGELQRAVDYRNQVLLFARAEGNRKAEAATLNNMGLDYAQMKEYRKALDYYNQALSLERAAGNRAGEAMTLLNIGSAYKDLGEELKALEYYNQAMPLMRLWVDRVGQAQTLNAIGKVHDNLGDKQVSLDYYAQSLALFRAEQNPMGEGMVLVDLMEHWKRLQNPSLAVLFGKQAIDRFQQIRKNIRGLEREDQRSFLRSAENYYRELADLLISVGRLPEAQQVLDLLKIEEYSDFAQYRGNSGSETKPVALTPMEEKANKEYERINGEITSMGEEWTQLQIKSSRTADEAHRYKELSDNLTAANHRWQAFLNNLYDTFGKGDPANARVDAIDEQTAGLQTLVGELGAGTAAVYTLVLDQKCVLMLITPATRVAHEISISKLALREKVFAFASALAGHHSEEDIQARAQDLYNVLIAPIEKDLQGARARTLVWSLDDVLRYVPLAALYDGQQYLVERYRNVVITTASVGNLKDQPQVGRWRGLAMGVSKDYEGLGRLKTVPDELASVIHSDKTAGSHGPVPGVILLDDSFTETGMETELEQHPLLVHIASHYVFQAGNDTKSYLLLGGKEAGGQGFHLTLADLRDDQRMDFKGIELLTLSGCQTAVGSNNSDGREIDGLGITAQRKGAKAVMATLWAVDDASVGLLMATFYKLWVSTPGITKAEALQRAQLSLLHRTPNLVGAFQSMSATDSSANQSTQYPASEYANPFYWAPFILMGNWK